MTPKERFVEELNPLLVEADKAISAGNAVKARAISHAVLLLVRDYADLMTPAELREALNNPTANAIAKKLGVLPQ